jgi:flagellar motor switch protein FliN
VKPPLSAWLASLASVIERLTGARPCIHPEVVVDANAELPELLWWEPDPSATEPSLWIGAEASVRQALGHAAAGTVTIGETGGDAEPGYRALLQQSWQSLDGSVGGGRMTAQPQNVQLFRIPIELPGKVALQLFVACREASHETRDVKPVQPPRVRTGTSLDLLLDTEIPLTVHFGSTRMLLQDIVRLSSGSVVDLNRGMDEPVDIVVNGHLVARGDVVSVQGSYALRVTEIRERRSLPLRGGASIV